MDTVHRVRTRQLLGPRRRRRLAPALPRRRRHRGRGDARDGRQRPGPGAGERRGFHQRRPRGAGVRSRVHLGSVLARPVAQPAVRVRAQRHAPADPRDLRLGAGQPGLVDVGDPLLFGPARCADDRRHRAHRPEPEAPRRRGRGPGHQPAGRHRQRPRHRDLPTRPPPLPGGAARRGPDGRRRSGGPPAAGLRDHREAPRGRRARPGCPRHPRGLRPDPHRLGPVLRQGQRALSRREVARPGGRRRPVAGGTGRAADRRGHRDVRGAAAPSTARSSSPSTCS